MIDDRYGDFAGIIIIRSYKYAGSRRSGRNIILLRVIFAPGAELAKTTFTMCAAKHWGA